MDQALDFEGLQFIPSKEAARLTGYAKDYIGQICREGRVEARRVGRAWFVNLESIEAHKKTKAREKVNDIETTVENIFIKKEESEVESAKETVAKNKSIASVSNWYPAFRNNKVEQPIKYFSDDASLFPPIGELSKFDRLKKVNAPVSFVGPVTIGPTTQLETISEPEVVSKTLGVGVAVPQNKIKYISEDYEVTSLPKPQWGFSPLWFKPVSLAFTLLMLLIGGTQLNQLSVSNFVNETKDQLVSMAQRSDLISSGIELVNRGDIQAAVLKTADLNLISNLSSLARHSIFPALESFSQSASVIVYKTLTAIPNTIRGVVYDLNLYSSRFALSDKDGLSSSGISKEERRGLVVTPTQNDVDNSVIITDIKNTFSDEVEIYPDETGNAGIIRPVFKDRHSNDFLYVLVPLEETEE